VGHARLRPRRRRGVVTSHYDILVDGERVARFGSAEDVHAWVAKYRDDHGEDDPSATHLQILERGMLGWITGGRLVDRERFV
jgi:hypothetical protein